MRARSCQRPLGVPGGSCGPSPSADYTREKRRDQGPPQRAWTSHSPLWVSVSPLGPSLTGASPPLSVSKDEYLADLYHFATKEDTYANYFIHVSP